jgi:transglutaminase-like putative cysteine protease
MSQLVCTETGNVIASLCEELGEYRRARKVLHLPTTEQAAALYFLARSHPQNTRPLAVSVNGSRLGTVPPQAPGAYYWYDLRIPPSMLVGGDNEFEFWADAPAMDAWSLAFEDGHGTPRSFVSSDGGRTWRNEKMGYLNTSRGEYVVRVRVDEGSDPPAPAMVWEEVGHPRLGKLREMLPTEVLDGKQGLEQVRALATWVCTAWEYSNTNRGVVYTPWDAQTILAWGKAQQGHNGLPPVVMCVHYTVTFVSFCSALAIPARCAAFTGAINGYNGHFTAEVWLDEFQKWVMVDPTLDAILFQEGVPLSVTEIREAGPGIEQLVQWGPGYAFQMRNPLNPPWVKNSFLNGACFTHRSVWPRTDFLSHPELTPAGHGATSYCETGLGWEQADVEEGFGMFQRFADRDYFEAPPPG